MRCLILFQSQHPVIFHYIKSFGALEDVLVLQMAAEKFVCDYLAMAYIPIKRCEFNGSQECAFHRKAVTVIPKDLHLVKFFYDSLGVGHPLVGTIGPPKSVG